MSDFEDLTPFEQQVLDEAPQAKHQVLKRQFKEAKKAEAEPIEDKIAREFKYLDQTQNKPYWICTQTKNSKERIATDGSTIYIPDAEEKEVVISIPYEANFGQPGYANRLLRKGIKFRKVTKEDQISRHLSSSQDENAFFRQNVETILSSMKNESLLEEKERRIKELEDQLNKNPNKK